MSISQTFYEHLFRTKIFSGYFKSLQIGFDIFWQKEIGAKAAHKMLVKWTTKLHLLPGKKSELRNSSKY